MPSKVETYVTLEVNGLFNVIQLIIMGSDFYYKAISYGLSLINIWCIPIHQQFHPTIVDFYRSNKSCQRVLKG